MERSCIFAALFATLFIGSAVAVDWDVTTDLDQYVHSDDGHFSYVEWASYNYPGVTMYIFNMTSQMYQTDAFSTQSIWWHWLLVAIPDEMVHPDAAWMLIDGGKNENLNVPPFDDAGNAALALLALDTGVISACVKYVPNQPIYFHNDPDFDRRMEDSIISWTWRTFIDSPEPSDATVILRMPMTKAAKRAMDAVTEIAKIRRPETDVQKFIIYGASKRGWTTWSIAAVDRRVVAIAPMVFSLINMDETLQGHFRDMDGAWSFALRPYFKENLTQEFFNEKTKRVWAVEDMYSYKERYTIPILEIVSTGDEFFLCDDNHSWWDDIPSENKYLMMMPNSEHSMAPHYLQIYGTTVSFGLSVLENIPMPRVSWEMGQTETGGFIHFVTDPPPLDIRVFRAVTLASDTRRDFRLAHGTPDNVSPHPVVWRRNVLQAEDLGGGEYRVVAENVEGEWVGFFVEAEWEGPSGRRMVFTSQVNIIPNTYPHGPCTDPESCWGTLV